MAENRKRSLQETKAKGKGRSAGHERSMAMILAIDMGNTNIKVGIISEGESLSVKEERLMTDYDKTSMEYALMIMSILEFYKVDREDFEGAVISSVVPPLTGVIETAVKKALGLKPLIVNGSMDMSISLEKLPIPELLGADLIIGAEAAFNLYKPPVIIINMGTATTLTLVGESGRFEGGLILPGLKTSISALASGTAQLPEIDLSSPGSVITIDTVESMRSGIIYGNAAQLDGLIGRMEAELTKTCTVVATGGLSRFVIPYCRHDILMDDKLLMKGLLMLYKRNKVQ